MKRELGMRFDWGKSKGNGVRGGEVELRELWKRDEESRVRVLEAMNECCLILTVIFHVVVDWWCI